MIYNGDDRFEVSSAGTAPDARQMISRELLEWADTIVVMEKHHRNFIRQHFPDIYQRKKIVCLYIPDEYDYMQPVLISLIKERVEDVYRRGLL